MKALVIIGLLALSGCGPNSSPEGRMSSKIDEVRQELDSLKKQNAAILDSIGKLNKGLKEIKAKP